MRVLVVLVAVLSVASAFAPSTAYGKCSTQLFSGAVFPGDQFVPEEVRSKRSKSIRDKLLGDREPPFVPDGDCPLIAAQKEKDRNQQRRKRKDGHPLLAQMTKFLDQYVVQNEKVDFNS